VADIAVIVTCRRWTLWLEHEDSGALDGTRTVLDTERHGVDVSGFENDGYLAHLDRELTVEAEEELVGLIVNVPCVVAVDPNDVDVVVVGPRNDAWLPGRIESVEGFVEIERPFHRFTLATEVLHAASGQQDQTLDRNRISQDRNQTPLHQVPGT
jgi:hypothetical protein